MKKNRCMVRWIIFLMDGQNNMDGRMVGWMDRKKIYDGWKDKKINRWMIGWIEKNNEKNRWMVRWKDNKHLKRQMDGQMYGQKNRWMVGRKDNNIWKKTDGWLVGWIENKYMKKQMDGGTDIN